MRKISLLCLLSLSAFAGERLLGVIQSIDSTKSNISQSPDAGVNMWDGGFQQPFFIPPMALITLRCDVDTYVCTDKTSCTGLTGLPVPGTVIFPTSVGDTQGTIATIFDGGGQIRSAVISVLATSVDAGYHACSVWERKGNE